MEQFKKYLADLDAITTTVQMDGKKEYIQPSLKNAANLSIVLIREAIAPVIFRNAEEEITDIDINGQSHVRGVPNKFKYPEKGRGLQVLRALGVGGKHSQNKTVLLKGEKPSQAYDLNTLVFGDSVVQDGRVLSVKAAVNYSDALSIERKELCVDSSFHNAAAEDGSLFDSEVKKNSNSLFTRHFIRPNTLMVQVISTRGKLLPMIGLDHLLLSIGVAGAYGGQTSVTGTNIKTHVVGIYGGTYESALCSPYELVKLFGGENSLSVEQVKDKIHTELSGVYRDNLNSDAVENHITQLLHDFDNNNLDKSYQESKPVIDNYFDSWFGSK